MKKNLENFEDEFDDLIAVNTRMYRLINQRSSFLTEETKKEKFNRLYSRYLEITDSMNVAYFHLKYSVYNIQK